MIEENITVVLAGNPNCGKTTIFNNLTGARQHVGNYPGVTVERREGSRVFGGKEIVLVDLPGTYSLHARSMDELIARNVVINEQPDVVINILDAANLERNLYLAVQLLELERPMVLGLNMMDMAKQAGEQIDLELLQQKLGVPVIPLIGNRKKGSAQLLQETVAVAGEQREAAFVLDYGDIMENEISALMENLREMAHINYPLRWLAIRLLENDADIMAEILRRKEGVQIAEQARCAQKRLEQRLGEEVLLFIAQKRYAFAGFLYEETVKKEQVNQESLSDRIDRIMTHRLWGLPLFFFLMWGLFNFVFVMGEYPKQWIEDLLAGLGEYAGNYIADEALRSLVQDAVIGGTGTVLSFLPYIVFLFLGISLLEDTGYMARAAFVIDRVMRSFGLHGEAFITLLLGFGCNVPAIMGARTLEYQRDRMVTMLIAPWMSCSARLPVYTLFIAAFFPGEYAGSILLSLYLLGAAVAVCTALLLKKTVFRGEEELFVMEMPPYHLPVLRSILLHMWERSVLYLRKAGTLILSASVMVWFLTHYPAGWEEDQGQNEILPEAQFFYTENFSDTGIDKNSLTAPLPANVFHPVHDAADKLAHSYAGYLGQKMEPVLEPLGMDWRMGIGLISAVAAQEVLVSTLGTIYSAESTAENTIPLQSALQSDAQFSPLKAYTVMVFTLLYSPCLAALAVMRRECGGWRWPFFSFAYSLLSAWCIAFVLYQTGCWLGLGT